MTIAEFTTQVGATTRTVATLPTDCKPERLTSTTEVKDWFTALFLNDLEFHLDDSLETVVTNMAGDRMLDDDAAAMFNRLVSEARDVCDAFTDSLGGPTGHPDDFIWDLYKEAEGDVNRLRARQAVIDIEDGLRILKRIAGIS